MEGGKKKQEEEASQACKLCSPSLTVSTTAAVIHEQQTPATSVSNTRRSPGSLQAFNLRLGLRHWSTLEEEGDAGMRKTVGVTVASSYWILWQSIMQMVLVGLFGLQS